MKTIFSFIIFLISSIAYCPTCSIPISIVDVAIRDLGVKEGTKRADDMMRRCGYKSSKEPWCAAAVSEWLSDSGYEMRVVSVRKMKDMFSSLRKVPPSSGAIVFFKHSHVGVVKEVRKDYVLTIEGNVNNKVMVVARNYDSISYCIKPPLEIQLDPYGKIH